MIFRDLYNRINFLEAGTYKVIILTKKKENILVLIYRGILHVYYNQNMII